MKDEAAKTTLIGKQLTR